MHDRKIFIAHCSKQLYVYLYLTIVGNRSQEIDSGILLISLNDRVQSCV